MSTLDVVSTAFAVTTAGIEETSASVTRISLGYIFNEKYLTVHKNASMLNRENRDLPQVLYVPGMSSMKQHCTFQHTCFFCSFRQQRSLTYFLTWALDLVNSTHLTIILPSKFFIPVIRSL